MRRFSESETVKKADQGAGRKWHDNKSHLYRQRGSSHDDSSCHSPNGRAAVNNRHRCGVPGMRVLVSAQFVVTWRWSPGRDDHHFRQKSKQQIHGSSFALGSRNLCRLGDCESESQSRWRHTVFHWRWARVLSGHLLPVALFPAKSVMPKWTSILGGLAVGSAVIDGTT